MIILEHTSLLVYKCYYAIDELCVYGGSSLEFHEK